MSPKLQGPRRAGGDAGRLKACTCQGDASVALAHRVVYGVVGRGAIGAGRHAFLAPDAHLGVLQHQPRVRLFRLSGDRAVLHALRVVAVVAAQGERRRPHMGERPSLEIVHPAVEHAPRAGRALPCRQPGSSGSPNTWSCRSKNAFVPCPVTTERLRPPILPEHHHSTSASATQRSVRTPPANSPSPARRDRGRNRCSRAPEPGRPK